MKQISLPGGLVALIDDDDFQRAKGILWYSKVHRGRRYVYGFIKYFRDGKRTVKSVYLQRFVMNFPKKIVGFIDGNGLNCKKENLRLMTPSESRQFSKKRSDWIASKFKGVRRDCKGRKWIAAVSKDNRRILLGSFETEKEAAEAYDLAVKKLYGKRAKTNF